MKRRELVYAFAAAGTASLLNGCRVASSPRIRRIGYLSAQAQEVHDSQTPPFIQKLRALGHFEGRDIEMSYRVSDQDASRLPNMVSELLAVPVDVIVADGGPAHLAAKAATDTVPIVVLVGPDPVKKGLVVSLARPGGNVTGVSIDPIPQNAKKLQPLKQVAPAIRRVAVIYRADNTSIDSAVAAQEAGPSLALDVEIFGALDIPQLDRAFARIAAGRFDAIMTTSLLSVVRGDLGHIPDFATRLRLPQIFGDIDIARRGAGLMHYGPDFALVHEEAAVLVHKILNGAWPGDLPIALPTKIDFVVNLPAARRIGIEFPELILRQATDVIS